MNIEAFLLCDAATDQQGKLNVLGAFDAMMSQNIPAVLPGCAVAARVRFEKIEEGKHTARINIIDQDGKTIGPKVKADLLVKVPDNMNSLAANLCLNIQRLQFENYGTYRIDFAIDGEVRANLPFRVLEPPNQD